MTAPLTAEIDKPYRGRRLSWREFYALRPDLKADNDNDAKASEKARQRDTAIAALDASDHH